VANSLAYKKVFLDHFHACGVFLSSTLFLVFLWLMWRWYGDNAGNTIEENSALYVSKNVPPLQLAIIFYIYSSIATIFGVNVAEKVGNQNLLYFPTTPN